MLKLFNYFISLLNSIANLFIIFIYKLFHKITILSIKIIYLLIFFIKIVSIKKSITKICKTFVKFLVMLIYILLLFTLI